jgi:hypothetical protein
MTKREAAIVSAYTGFLCGEFTEFSKYVEEIMGRPVFTHEMGLKTMADVIHIKSKDDFCTLTVE